MTPSDPAPGFALERPLPRTPFGDAWAARAVDGEAVMVIALAPQLVGLVDDRARLGAALRARLVAAGPGGPGGASLLVDAPDGRLAIVLPREERTPASVRLALGRTFSTADVADAARALGAALHAAHADGTRHGALAPGMLYIGDGEPARAIGHGWVGAFVEAGADRGEVLATVGARAFAAPELVHAADVVPTAASDVYALGATLYACLTGRPPFGGRTTATIMANVLADEALTDEMPSVRRGDLADAQAQAAATERLTQALLRAVERAPEDRWPTAADFVSGLDGGVPTPGSSPALPRSAPARLRAATRSALGAFLQHGFLARLLSRHELR